MEQVVCWVPAVARQERAPPREQVRPVRRLRSQQQELIRLLTLRLEAAHRAEPEEAPGQRNALAEPAVPRA